MTSPYVPTNYVDDSVAEPVDAANLNKSEQGIAAATQLAVSAVSAAKVGQPNGVMGLDGSGVGAQPPQPHTHPFTLVDEAGVPHGITQLVYSGDAGGVTVSGTVGTINAKSKYVRVFPVTQISGQDPQVTSSTTLLTIPSITQTIEAGAEYDFLLTLWVKSTNNVRGRAIITADAAAVVFAQFYAPAEYEQLTSPTVDDTSKPLIANNDGGLYVDRYRYTPITIPTLGAQRFGGFKGDGTISYVRLLIEGYIGNPTSSAISMTSRFSQAVAGTDVTSVVPKASSLLMARR